MMENEIVAHLTKGISEEIYQSIIILDIASIDEFIKWCRKTEASNKKRVKKRVVFDRLQNVTAIDSADSESMEDLIRRIVREEVHRALNPESTTPEPSSLKEIIREEIEKNVAAISKPIQRPPPRQSYPNQTRTFNQVPRQASNAVIDCGRAEIRLEEAKDVLNSPASMGKVVASRSVVIPAESTKLINVMSEELNGQNQVLFEPSKKVLIGKGLTPSCALFRLSHNKGKLWIVNSSTTAQIVPKGMYLGKIQRVEENNLTAISECSESNKEVKNANHASHADKSDFKFLQNLISDDLSEEQQSQILSILKRYDKIFDKNNEPVKQTSLAKHKIETGNHQPIKHRPYRVSRTERQAIQTEVDKMLDAGIIRHSESPWSSPVILVKKKDGNWRFCVDYRRLNKVTKKDVYPLPRIDDTLDSLKGAKFYSSMDLRSGYWQIEVDEADREKTAFITPDGLYEFLVMPFGLCNAPATFERMMDKILKGLKWTMALCYLDDIVVYSKSFNEHLHRLEIILQCLDKAELRLNPKKCLFGTKRIRVFGHLVDSKGIYTDPEKIEAIAKFPTPKSITDVRSFIGLCSYYRRFIENFAEKAAPLHGVLKKDNKFMWNSDQQDAFDSLKKALMSEPVLAYFEEQLPTELHTDASGYGIGAVLVQINNGKERPVGYASRTLSKAEKNYSTTERECLAAIWAINKFRPYLFGREFVIVTDHHALCWLSNLKDPTGRLERWPLKLQEYNVTVVYKSGRKHQKADCLSRNTLQLESEEAYNDEDDDIPSMTALTCFEAEQRKDPKICKLIEETERFGAESKGYEMLKGTLYKKNFDPLGNQHLLVIPKHLRLELLKSLHDAPTAGHLGFSKTYERVKNKYFWPGLLRDIRKYVAHCKECQRKKQSTQKPPGLLKAIPPATSPFQRVGMDLLGRFPKSDNGNKWIIVCTDYLTRFAVTKALPTGEAKESAKFLMEDVVLKHGAPREIITDRGRVFQSKLIAELTNQCSSIHRFTTAYHPQTNGLTERLNKTLANMIAMYVSVEQKDWDVILPYVTFAYNTAKQDTTGFTPFKLIHGREAETTVDTLFPNPHEDLQEDYSQKIASRVEETRQLARLETLKAQEKDKARYDSKHEAMDYNVGDLVWIFIPIRKVGLSEKLMKSYPLLIGLDVAGKIGLIIDTKDKAVYVKGNECFYISPETHLPSVQQKELNQLLKENQALFSQHETDIGRIAVQHKIHTIEHPPISCRPYRRPLAEYDEIKRQVEELSKKGLIRESQSPWAFPVVLVSKKDGSQRMCIDYRKLNAITFDDKQPLPYIQDMFDRLHNAKYFTTLDIAWGYWHVEMHPDSVEKTAFITNDGHCEFLVMPFGLKNAPSTFQRIIQHIIGNLLWNGVCNYQDDILIYSSTFKDHIELMKKIFDKLKENNIKLKLKKCSFAKQEIRYLGHIIGHNKIKPDLEKTKAINEFPQPKTVKQVRQFLGLADPVLSTYDPSLPCKLYTDASKLGIGAFLAQIGNDNQEHVISYYPGKPLPHQQNYSAFELECFAVVQSVEYFEVYLENNTFEVITDHSALEWLFNVKKPKAKYLRWIIELSTKSMKIVHRSGSKQTHVDALSRSTVHKPFIGEYVAPNSDLKPLELISMDTIVLGSAANETKHKYIQVIIDHLTRFVCAFPTVTNTSQAVIQCLDKINKTVPQIKCILTDNGKNFTSKEFNKFLNEHQVQHTYSTPYHPQSNGLCEKMNDTILTKLRTNFQENPRLKWSSLLAKIVKDYNSTPHDVTGFSPNFLLFGDCAIPEFSESPHFTIENARKKAIGNSAKHREKWKARHDAKYPQSSFKVGDLVLRKIASNYPSMAKTSP
ncbi:K02A2.6-like, partial [Cordylochernes scorpioides]